MTTQSIETLYQGFLDSMETGDDAKVVAYLEEHINEFPEDLKQKIIFATFENVVSKDYDDMMAVEKFKSEGLQVMTKLAEIKKEIEEAYKIAQLKDGLGA